jgi:uncharacterized repeat protein (TIGR01451 family)
VSANRHTHARLACVVLACLVFAALLPSRVMAFTASAENPAWTVTVRSTPTDFAPGDLTGDDVYEVIVTNTGDAPSNGETVTIADTLPTGLTLDKAGVSGTELLGGQSLSCTGTTCTFGGEVPAGDTLTVRVPVDVETEAETSVMNLVTVSGGGGAETSQATPTRISHAAPGFGIAPGSFALDVSAAQAGAHADASTSFFLNENAAGETEGRLAETAVELPAGFAGDPLAAPQCSEAQLGETTGITVACPPESQVGTVTVYLEFPGCGAAPACAIPVIGPVYDMRPQGGEVARLGFNIAVVTSNIVFTVTPGSYRLHASVPNIVSGTLTVLGSVLTIWGVPQDRAHDMMRGTVCFSGSCFGQNEGPVGAGVKASDPPEPFSSNPTGCEGPSQATIAIDSFQRRAEYAHAEAGFGPLSGCERLQFNPGLSVAPTNPFAETATGLNVGLTLPQTYGDPATLATASLKNAVVTLPAGMTINPSAGAGLGGCTRAQYEAEALNTPAGAGCPNNSNLGTVNVHTPVLKEELTGSVFLAQPYENPFSEPGHPTGSLLALYVIARIPDRGLIVKLAGKATLDPVTGQIVTEFQDNPQLPFDEFTLRFHPGATAPLVTPPTCGSFQATAEFGSWAQPDMIDPVSSPSFPIAGGVGGSACPSGGIPPFNPSLQAGSYSATAGAYSPFYANITRNDGEQELASFGTVLPPGLSGNLTGIPFCPEADIEAARAKTGRQELTEPSCPAASEIGHTQVGAGVGSVLVYTPGKIYLAGPFHGAPLSIVSITSATVGPFDLGTVVIRFALHINPLTTQVEVDPSASEAIPHIIHGIVTHVREINVYIDKPNFTLDPTSCAPQSLKATIVGTGADPANPADQTPVTVTDPYQAVNCANLTFKPTFNVTTSAHTSKTNGASLTAKLTFPTTTPNNEANIALAKVELPKQLPSRLTTLQKACLANVFEANPAGCPAASIVGHAKAITPLIPVPLEGPAYFVSHGGEAFPSLIVVLQGYGITINLVGTTFISKAGITSSTFKTVPDQPVSSFELTLPQGPYSALTANGNLCATKLAMPTEFVAQNGAKITQTTPISVEGCKPAIRVLKHSVNGKTTTVTVSVPAAGELTATAKGLSKARAQASKAQTVTVKLTLSKGEQAFLAKHKGRKLKANVNLQFTPKKGSKLKTTVTIVIA